MRRRDLLVLLSWSTAAYASGIGHGATQPATARRRIGILLPTNAADTEYRRRLDVLRQTLRDHGWIDGKNIALDIHYIDGSADRAEALAREMVESKVDVIVTQGARPVQAARAATTTIPIIMAEIGDAVATGLVTSLARPGGNITGFTLVSTEQSAKRLELAKESFPAIARVAVVWSEEASSHHLQLEQMERAAPILGLSLEPISINRSSDIDARLQSALRSQCQVIITLDDPLVQSRRAAIIAFGMAHRLPVIGEFRANAEAGALLSYGPDQIDHYRRTALYIDRILKGEKPGDLPVQQPTKFELVINLKAANALGVAVPPLLLTRADAVIE